MSTLKKAGWWSRLKAHREVQAETKKPMTDLKRELATECKERTKKYFDSLPSIGNLSPKAKQAARLITKSNFGCSTENVAELVSLLIGEDITGAVKVKTREHPGPGVMILFLSTRISAGNWVPSLCVGRDGSTAQFINNIEDKEQASALGEDQVNTARQPSDKEIDDYFELINSVSLRLAVRSEFGADALTK